MKGQFFLISGVVVVIILFLIKSSLSLTKIIENKRNLDANMERKEFLNVRNELIKTVEYSYNKNESEKIENYIVYVKGRLMSRVIEFRGIAIETSFKNVTAGMDTDLNITAYNFLGETVLSLNLSFDDSTQSFSNLADGASLQTNFTFNTDSDVNYTLSVNYSTATETEQHVIVITVEIGKSKFVAFFDMRMIGLRTENRDVFTKVVGIV